ncbi:MAG TPA: hypothetical protein VF779_18635 [Pyrinomonadaceae bacterium]
MKSRKTPLARVAGYCDNANGVKLTSGSLRNGRWPESRMVKNIRVAQRNA